MPNCACFLFCRRRKYWHDFVTPFSTLANIKGSLPTNSTTPDRLRCRTRRDGEDFPVFLFIFLFQHRQKEVFSKVPASSPDQHPKRSPWPDFRDRRVSIRVINAGKKEKHFGAASLYYTIWNIHKPPFRTPHSNKLWDSLRGEGTASRTPPA